MPIYQNSGLAPPLFGVALALGQLLQRTELPSGAIHSLQEFDTLQAIGLDSRLRTLAWLKRRRERGDLRFLTFSIEMADQNGQTALEIKTTLLEPGPQEEQRASRDAGSTPGEIRERALTHKGELGQVTRTISQTQLVEYSSVSGDNNRLHLDPEFAAGTQFGGIIAHGMLTLAFISEMMAASHGGEWLTSGSMKARFKGAARPGDQVETWGAASKSDGGIQGYAVGLRNSSTAEDLITGTATLKNS